MKTVAWRRILSRLSENRFAAMGVLFAVGGLLVAIGSFVTIIRFLYDHVPITRDFTADELIYGIIMPHVALLFGLTLGGYGIVLLRRHEVASILMVAGRRPRRRVYKQRTLL